MNNFTNMFSKKKAFIPFFMLGDPNPDDCFELIKAAIDAGASALELGIPFSDPVADGPVIQAAAHKALNNGIKLQNCLDIIRKIRDYSPIPIGLLVYYNLLFHNGLESIYTKLKQAGVDAVLAVDLPLEEAELHEEALAAADLGCIHLIAPNTPEARAKELLERSTAFTYVVSKNTTTGVQEDLPAELSQRISQLKTLSKQPIVIGFGISNAKQVKMLHDAGADGAIIGSSIIKIIADNDKATAKQKIITLVTECVE